MIIGESYFRGMFISPFFQFNDKTAVMWETEQRDALTARRTASKIAGRPGPNRFATLATPVHVRKGKKSRNHPHCILAHFIERESN